MIGSTHNISTYIGCIHTISNRTVTLSFLCKLLLHNHILLYIYIYIYIYICTTIGSTHYIYLLLLCGHMVPLWCIYIWLCNNVNFSLHAIYMKKLKVTVLLEIVCMHPIYVLILCVHPIMMWSCNNVSFSLHTIYLRNLNVTVLLEMVCNICILILFSFYGSYIDDYAILHYVEDVHVIWYVHIY